MHSGAKSVVSGLTTSYSSVSVIPEISVIQEVTVSATGAYTCPANTKSKVVHASMSLESVGADASYSIAILRTATYTAFGLFVVALGLSEGSAMMQAADILTLIGDSGSTNGDGHIVATIQEISL